MSAPPTLPTSPPDPARSRCAAQTLLHGRQAGPAAGLALALAVALGSLLRDAAPTDLLGAWLGAFGAAAVLRWGLQWRLLQTEADPGNACWRTAHRLALMLQGMGWALGCAVLLQVQQPLAQDLLLLTLTGLVAAQVLALRFDPVAALLFALPTALALLPTLAARPPLAASVSLPVAAALLLAAAVAPALARRLPAAARAAARAESIEEALRVAGIVINATTEQISVVDEDHVYQLVNDAWCRATGLAREQVIGRRSFDVLPGAVTAERRQAVHDSLQRRQRVTVRDVLSLPPGGRRHLHTEFLPIESPDGARRLVALTTRDVTLEETQRTELVEAADCLTGTLEATGDAIFATDQDDVDRPVRFANAQLLRLLGLPDQLRPGLNLRTIEQCMDALVEDPAAERQQVAAIVAAGVPAEHRLHLRCGRVLQRRFACVSVSGRPLRVWSMRDVTAEHQATLAREAAAAEQRLMLESFPGYIVVLNESQHYRFVNARTAALMRLPAEQIVGLHASQVLGQERWTALLPVWERAQRQGLAVSESRYPRPDGSGELVLEVTHVAGPAQADGSRTIYAFGIDITERQQALAEAERANKAKSQFLSRMSHELRTPLNAVLGFGQLLTLQPLPPQALEQAGAIVQGGRHLLSLINDLLDLGRVEAGELELAFEPVPAAAAIDEAVGLLRNLALEHEIELRAVDAADPAACALADPRRLRQVLINLMSNAIKYNRHGGQVEAASATVGDDIEFRVRDDGDGLSTEQQQRLFRPFERLGGSSAAVDGTGIGLALSRNLVEAMGGRIGVSSAPGQGSTFWFRLPRASEPPAAAPVATPAMPAAPGPRRRALYIEDNPVNLLLMEAMLEGELELQTEADPLRGLALALAAPPDLILLDILLPGIDGFEVLRRLRADERTRAVPVVAVSANAMDGDRAAGQAAGFDAYLCKPVDLQQLLDTVRRLTGRSG